MSKKTPFNGKILNILKTFDSVILERFGQYLVSPLIKKVNKRVIQLFQVLQSFHPNYENLYTQELYHQIYDKTIPFKEGTFRNLVSDLYKPLKGFLAFLEYEQETTIQKDLLLKALLRRQLQAVFQKEQKQISKVLKKQLFKDAEQLYEQFLISRRVNQQVTTFNPRAANTSLQTVMQDLDIFFFAAKLKYFVAAKTWERIVKTKYDLWLMEEILNFIQASPTLQGVPIIKLYYLFTLALIHPTQTNYLDTALTYLQKHDKAFPKHETRHLYKAILNSYRWKINEGHLNYAQKALDLYKNLLDKEFLYVLDYFPTHQFRNIVQVGIESRNLTWTENFIKTYTSKTRKIHREKIKHYSLAALRFAQKDYQNAKKYLAMIYSEDEFIDFYYHIYYKTLQIKTFYETQEIEAALNALEAFRLYLTRHKTAPLSIVKTYQNFIKVARKLTNRKSRNYIAFVERTEPLIEKYWLSEKASLLDRRRSG